MRMFSFVLAPVFMLFSAPVWAAPKGSVMSTAAKAQLVELVDAFEMQRDVLALASPSLPEECLPADPTACMTRACQMLGSFGCDTREKSLEILRACRGNYSQGCLNIVCQKLGAFGCDERDEVVEVAQACSGTYDGMCVSQVCNQLGTFGCDERDEILEVARSCGGH